MLVTLGGKTITGAIGSLITLAGWNTTHHRLPPASLQVFPTAIWLLFTLLVGERNCEGEVSHPCAQRKEPTWLRIDLSMASLVTR